MSVKLVHVGLGGWGGDWEMNAIPRVSEIERVAWVDAHEPTLETAKKKLDLPDDRCFTSIEDAFSAVEADALLITAPQQAHIPLAIQAMEAGKHVLVEKPLAVSVEEARRGIEASDRTGKVLMVSQQYRNYPAVRKAAQLVSDRHYGRLGTINVDFRKWANSAPRDGHKHYFIQHPLIYDMSIHHFDLMRLIIGEDAVRVYAKPTDPAWSKFEQEGAAAITIEFEGGAIVSYRGSWISPGRPTNWAGEWNLECEKGNIYFTSRAGGEIGVGGDEVRVTPTGKDEEKVRLVQPRFWGRSAGLVRFAEAIASNSEPETSARNNLGSLALMEATGRASLSGKVEDVEKTS